MSSYQSESQLEDALIQRLQGKGWEKVHLASEDDPGRTCSRNLASTTRPRSVTLSSNASATTLKIP